MASLLGRRPPARPPEVQARACRRLEANVVRRLARVDGSLARDPGSEARLSTACWKSDADRLLVRCSDSETR